MATPVTDDTFRCELRFVGEYVIRYRGREIPVRSTYVEKLFALIGGPEPTRSVPLSPGRACTIFHEALGHLAREEASSRSLAKEIIYSHRNASVREADGILDSLESVDRELLRLRQVKILLIAGSLAAEDAASQAVSRQAKVA